MTSATATSDVYRQFAAAAARQVAWAAEQGYHRLVKTFQAEYDALTAAADKLAAQGR